MFLSGSPLFRDDVVYTAHMYTQIHVCTALRERERANTVNVTAPV